MCSLFVRPATIVFLRMRTEKPSSTDIGTRTKPINFIYDEIPHGTTTSARTTHIHFHVCMWQPFDRVYNFPTHAWWISITSIWIENTTWNFEFRSESVCLLLKTWFLINEFQTCLNDFLMRVRWKSGLRTYPTYYQISLKPTGNIQLEQRMSIGNIIFTHCTQRRLYLN